MVTLAICPQSIPPEVVGFVVPVGLHGLLQVTDVVEVITNVVVCDEVEPCVVVVETPVGPRVLVEATVVVTAGAPDGKLVLATSPRVAAIRTAPITPTAIFFLYSDMSIMSMALDIVLCLERLVT
jgi:ABC-type histidine transport system ATPase subunit